MAVALDDEELADLRLRLKSGEYDGVDVMHAWLVVNEAQRSERPLDRLVRRLPAPRLQLRWARNPDASCRFGWLCHYELVLPLGEHDIRREVYDDDGELSGEVEELVVAMKEPTRRDADCVPCTAMRGERYADSPYRDGAHAKWDAAALGNLPVFVIAPDGEAFVEQPNA